MYMRTIGSHVCRGKLLIVWSLVAPHSPMNAAKIINAIQGRIFPRARRWKNRIYNNVQTVDSNIESEAKGLLQTMHNVKISEMYFNKMFFNVTTLLLPSCSSMEHSSHSHGLAHCCPLLGKYANCTKTYQYNTAPLFKE